MSIYIPRASIVLSQTSPCVETVCVAPTLSYKLVEEVAAVTLSVLPSVSVALVCALGKVEDPI